MVERVVGTGAAKAVVDELQQQYAALIFHQSGGCCDGSAPMCFPEEDFYLDDNDVLLGNVFGCKFYMSKDQFEYWKHTQIILDVVKGRGSSFSVEAPLGIRFISKSKLLPLGDLKDIQPSNSNNMR